MMRSALLLSLIACAVSVNFGVTVAHSAYGQNVDLLRSSLLYGLGRIEAVSEDSAQVDLGDVHTLKIGDHIAVVRSKDNYFVPVGVLQIVETRSTVSWASRATGVKPQKGDIVMFVREFSQIRNGDQHRDDFVKQQMIKSSGNNQYSTFRNAEVAVALADYKANYDKWERSKKDVVGYLTGVSFAEGRMAAIEPLLKQIDMMRELHRGGANSLPAAGERWVSVMNALLGPTVIAQHEASQSVVVEDDVVGSQGRPTVRDIERQVKDVLFDRLPEEQNLITYLIASVLESPPRDLSLWFEHRVGQSQFPQMAYDSAMLEHVRRILQKLQGDS